jgi:hypothetical protein
LQQFIFDCGDSQRTLCAIPFGNIVSSDEFGTGPLLLQALHEAVEVLVQVLLIGLGTPLIHPGGGILPDVAPALLQEVLVEPPLAGAEPISLVTWVWLFFDDVHLMISRCGAGLERCVWLGWETVPRREA